MADVQKSPGFVASLFLLLLGGVAIFCGIDAILSESVTTPAKFGGTTRVYGADTVLVGMGWILVGVGIISKIVASFLEIPSGSWIALGLCIAGGLFWLSVLL